MTKNVGKIYCKFVKSHDILTDKRQRPSRLLTTLTPNICIVKSKQETEYPKQTSIKQIGLIGQNLGHGETEGIHWLKSIQ